MNWNALLILLIGLYGSVYTLRYYRRGNSYKYLAYLLALISLSVGQGALVVDSLNVDIARTADINAIVDLGTITAISFTLCGLAVFIRDSKPQFAQFPLIYTTVPLFLIATYWLVRDSFAIQDWLVSIYEGGALLVGLLMFGVRYYNDRRYVWSLGSTILMTLTFLAYWFIPVVQTDFSWLWQIAFILALAGYLRGFEVETSEIEQS